MRIEKPCSNPLCTAQSQKAGLCEACYRYAQRNNGAMRDPEKTKRHPPLPVGTPCITCGYERNSLEEVWIRGECMRCYEHRRINGTARSARAYTRKLPTITRLCECSQPAVHLNIMLCVGGGWATYNLCQDCMDLEREPITPANHLERLQR